MDNVYTCPTCGAAVNTQYQTNHEQFHEALRNALVAAAENSRPALAAIKNASI